MATPAHLAIQGLPLMTWRGLKAPPYDGAGFSFSHSQAKKLLPYISGAVHDWTGMDPLSMPFKLYFLNTLGPDLFPAQWEKWQTALFDGSPGELRHPVLGVLDAVVTDGSVELVATATAGIVVNVTFEQTVLEPDKALAFDPLALSLQQMAQAADEWGQAHDVPFPSGYVATSLADLIGQIEGAIWLAKTLALALINQGLAIVGKLISTVAVLQDHATWPYNALLTQLYGGLLDLGDEMGQAATRGTTTVTYQHDATIDEVADATGNSLADVLGLNLALVRLPYVPAGTAVKVYRR